MAVKCMYVGDAAYTLRPEASGLACAQELITVITE
jgi:hypothetical protein